MLYPEIEKCIQRVGCKYTLTVVAAKRAKDLAHKMPGEFAESQTKELTYALNEISNGQVMPYFTSG